MKQKHTPHKLSLFTLIFSLFTFHSSLLSNTFLDKETGLIWQDNYDVKSVQRTWNGAKEYCKNLSLDGHDDWFLPTAEQLLTITDKSTYNPSIKKGFKNITSSNYWSATPDASNSKYAWFVSFMYGGSGDYDKAVKYYVRCARAGQSDTLTFDNFNKTVEQLIKKKLGVPEHNSFTMIDSGATQAKIKTNLKKMLRRVKSGDTIYFYYNGHGIPVPQLKYEPFMLTSDSEPDYVADESFFSLKNIYGKLSGSKASKVVAFVDSCFSGVTDGKAILKGVAATKMKSKRVSFDKEKMVVLSAGKSHQYSNEYNQKGHRLFSFYVMQNILEGKTDIRNLYKETKKETYQTSLENYGDSRTQEPTLEGNGRLNL
jgi:hypothetical protein